ncbi:branched-chain amino acid ABC transporter permease [Mesorhizobium australicum]|uniref:Amino acid/amide ABC transporter membrane protein 2, HAAT family n=1 Tax=Mesorhizobium australicum TaxID=536018 RepID=A0A1X7N064_9HYPH|nr:branched-chain amino acid ABC transporter permease [Mesorhizobium australicum]SMH30631.1 amino acid/amide ABC transporter membrane protein 2, HAAT family [Mesorhizobium australicum]
MSNTDIAAHAPPRASDINVPTLATELPWLAAAVAGCLALTFAFTGNSFALNILATAFLFGGLATAWNIIGGLGGQFSLGHSVFFAIGAYTTGNVVLGYALSPWLALVPGMAMAAAFGAAVSWPVFRLRGPFFAIATMALTEVMLALAMYFESITGGAPGLSIPFKLGFANMIFRDRMSYAFLMLGFLAVTLLVFAIIRHSRLGYSLQAIRDNEDTAEAAGIDVLRSKLVAMAISAALTAAGGCLYIMYVRVVDPPSLFSLFDVGVKIALIALIGGIGTTYGPLLGALLIIPLENYLRAEMGGVFPGSNLIVLGAILVVTALYLRKGVFGAASSLVGSWRSKRQ